MQCASCLDPSCSSLREGVHTYTKQQVTDSNKVWSCNEHVYAGVRYIPTV